ncbi:MBL fold metallo-hydrolase [Paenibacillus harenae]|uniref:Glyoxylase-like metal-dependent hydrolase (Beta-lactamase superfamily II) n=1 Tax=Paenibacillus harenae TaxID=306543 RepID=A0ABT9U6T0_PAEHA|nr:MBL fold metallo-hydrolase [Paenibacillus harenae]MDQ0115350.1 glyoxylase-like metal-dependent hydrolase (beta-lactamase superfamily II) [Paenibacillus harenae]
MQQNNGIQLLTISAEMMGKTETIYPTVLWDEENVLLIDAGYPGQLPLLKVELERFGIPFDKVNRIIVTHQDLDHIGGLPTITAALPHKPEIYASALEIPYIQGERRLLKITDAAIELAVGSLPPEVPAEWRAAFRRTLEHPPSAPVDSVLEYGTLLPYCGGIDVIGTHGHTPGHISLYHRPSKTLIAADSLRVVDGQLQLPDPDLCSDFRQACLSIAALIPFDIETVICYHGGIFAELANERIRQLACEAEAIIQSSLNASDFENAASRP